jgi:hypothetical protein
MRARRGRLMTLDQYERRVRRFFEGPSSVPTCRLTDARIRRELFVCGTTVRTVLYGPPGEPAGVHTDARASIPFLRGQAGTAVRHAALRALLDVGRLALRFVAARVHRAVELVGLDLALDILA